MTGLAGRLSSIAALRPAGTVELPALAGTSAKARARLAAMLEAQERTTGAGCHLGLTRLCRELASERPDRGALALLAGPCDAAADPGNWLFLDTETTGLAGGTGTYAFLVGLGWWDGDGLRIDQLFMRDFSEEPSLLEELAVRLAERPVLVTFNGKAFDWPLVETRFRIARRAAAPPVAAHLDLLHPARQIWQRRLGSVRLCEIERAVLGIRRSGDIPSETIPRRYLDFVRGGPVEPLVEVFRHNERDLVGLARLASALAKMLEAPDSASDPLDAPGLARLLDRRGASAAARAVCERALEHRLPQEIDRDVRRDLARIAKRERDHTRAVALWHNLAADPWCGVAACEELAIHYEHRARDVPRAAELAGAARERLREASRTGALARDTASRLELRITRRLDRLARKMGTEPG